MERDLKLVAPWWYWERQKPLGTAREFRETWPTIQKFDNPDFVEGYLKDPQRSLVFDPQVDIVWSSSVTETQVPAGATQDKRSRGLWLEKRDGKLYTRAVTREAAKVRKLFLDTHRRYYLVAFELHCDGPGFPSAGADEACQVGFVVRRRTLSYDRVEGAGAKAVVRNIVTLRQQLADLDLVRPLTGYPARKNSAAVAKLHAEGTFAQKRAELTSALTKERAALLEWKRDAGAAFIEEGWFPSGFENIGGWQVTEETPESVEEVSFPMFRVHADPAKPNHDAAGRTLYFGVIPTSSLQTTATGTARFDDTSAYLIRCFVRRHQPECPRTGDAPDCHGKLFWSRPTELYQLASHFDPEGTSNRPITIQMPDLADLAALAKRDAVKKFAPVRFIQKQSLQPNIVGMAVSGGKMGGFQICFFAIPLITLVALFVLNLFLPIVVFIFGLWFLLAFKLCIIPSIEVNLDVTLQAELAAALEAKVDIGLDLDVAGLAIPGVPSPPLFTQQLNARLADGVAQSIAFSEGLRKEDVDLGALANTPLAELAGKINYGEALGKQFDAGHEVGLELTAGLAWEPRVSHRPVIS